MIKKPRIVNDPSDLPQGLAELAKQASLFGFKFETFSLSQDSHQPEYSFDPEITQFDDARFKLNEFTEALSRNETGKYKKIINSGIDVNSRNQNGNTALHYAAMRDDITSAKTLVKCGAGNNISNGKGELPLDLFSCLVPL